MHARNGQRWLASLPSAFAAFTHHSSRNKRYPARVNRISVISDGTPKRFGGPQ